MSNHRWMAALFVLVVAAGACGAGGDEETLPPCDIIDPVLDQIYLAMTVDLYDATRDQAMWDGARPPDEYLDPDGSFRDDIPVDDDEAFAEWRAETGNDSFTGWIKSPEVNAVLDPHRQLYERAVVSVLTPCEPAGSSG